MDYLIIGVDPGTTTALAGIDLKGNLVFTWSKKNATEQEIINKILEYGQPIIFTTDKRKIPSFIKKLSDRFLVDVFSPKKDLGVEFKKNLIKEFNFKVKNIHELDALASALYYYKLNKRKIDYLLEKFGEKAIELMKYGYIKEIKETKEKIEEPMKIEKLQKFTEKDEEIFRLKKELLIKDFYLKKLKNKINYLKNKNKFLRKKINEIKKEVEIKLKEEIENVKKENEELKNKLNNFSKILEGLNKGELVLLWDWKKRYYTKLSFIKEDELEQISKNEMEKFRKLVKENDLSWYYDFGDIIVAKKKEVEEALSPKEDEIKKIKEYFKIYKIRRKNL